MTIEGDVVRCDGIGCQDSVPAYAFDPSRWKRRKLDGEVVFLCPKCYDEYIEDLIIRTASHTDPNIRRNPPRKGLKVSGYTDHYYIDSDDRLITCKYTHSGWLYDQLVDAGELDPDETPWDEWSEDEQAVARAEWHLLGKDFIRLTAVHHPDGHPELAADLNYPSGMKPLSDALLELHLTDGNLLVSAHHGGATVYDGSAQDFVERYS